MEKILRIKKNLEGLQDINSKKMSRNLNPEYKILPNKKIEVDPKVTTRRGLTTRKINYSKKMAKQGEEQINKIIDRRLK